MATFQTFNHSEKAGLALIALSGFISALSTSSLLGYIIWNGYLTKDKSLPLRRGIRSFVHSSLGSYLLSLLLSDFLQGAAFTINIKWAAEGNMKVGTACTIQGAVSEVGDLGAAIWSLAIAVHTFSLLFLVRKPNRLIAPIVLFVGWTVLIVLPIVGPTLIETRTKGSFYGLSGAWCWLSVPYGTERVIYLYVWVFTTLGCSILIYTLIYLRFSNFIIIDDNGKFQFQWKSKATLQLWDVDDATFRSTEHLPRKAPGSFWRRLRSHSRDTTGPLTVDNLPSTGSMSVSQDLKQVARRLMWYPIQYAIVVLPVSVCRMGVLAGWTPPFGLYSFAGICFAGSGITNSILFILTRHSLVKRGPRRKISGNGIRVTTQRIVIREGGSRGGFGSKTVELTSMNSENSNTTTGPYFKNDPFDTKENLGTWAERMPAAV